MGQWCCRPAMAGLTVMTRGSNQNSACIVGEWASTAWMRKKTRSEFAVLAAHQKVRLAYSIGSAEDTEIGNRDADEASEDGDSSQL